MVKKLKIYSNSVFDSSNYAFLDTERNAKNRSPLQRTVFEKIKSNCQKMAVFDKKNAFFTIFRQFFLILSRTVLCRGLWFFVLRSVSQNA